MASAQPLDFANLAPLIAERLLERPNKAMSTATELRFGTHGSLSVDLEVGRFYDHEQKAGGGMLDLIQRVRGCDMAGALAWLEDEGIKDREPRAAEVWQLGAHRAGPVFYDYRDEQGVILSRVKRTPDKKFWQLGPDGRGGFHSAKGCMEGVRRVPYRLPELLAADRGRAVFLVEGEKDADRLATAGMVASCNAEGAGKFRPELIGHFAGRKVVILADNDRAGFDHANDVATKLHGTAAAVTILLLPDLEPKEDVSDWLDRRGGTIERLKDLARASLETPVTMIGAPEPETFPLADLSLWARTAPTPKAFVMAPFIPRDDVVIITGDGGTNKSTLALQISACAAAGRPMLGMDVQPGPALYITAEDDDRENHWRLAKIADAIGTTLHDLAGRLHVVSLRGRLANELATFETDGKLRVAPAYALLRATIEATKATLVTLDNVAHLFAGNENDRSQVTAFINLLYQLCRDCGVTILLIAHRNKSGDTYSGSTAWLNAVRSQILLERSDETDADVRRMSLGKANYARPGEAVTFRWHDFALVRQQDLTDAGAEMAANVQASADNDRFLACLDERTRQQRAVSENEAAPRTYAPKVFSEMAESKGIGVKRLKGAMDRLYRTGAIERGYLWHAHRKPVEGLRRAAVTPGESAATPCGDPAATSCGDVRQPCGNPRETGGETHPYTTYRTGAALGAAAPDQDLHPTPAPEQAQASTKFPRQQGSEPRDLSRVVFGPEGDDVVRALNGPLPNHLRDPFSDADWPEEE
jgi:RecA-family ATPase